MKKFYATILATLLGTTAMMAEDSTFSFVINGEVITNGSTITLSEYHLSQDLGDMKIWEMPTNLFIRNCSEFNEDLSILVTGIDNYQDVQVCPDGNCRPWNDNTINAKFTNKVDAGDQVDAGIHVSYMDFENLSSFNYKSTITVRAYCTNDEDDFTQITINFDTNASSLNTVGSKQPIEVFNLCGKKIAESVNGLKKGIYIFRQGGTSRKVVIK